jgi:hypothetical protein
MLHSGEALPFGNLRSSCRWGVLFATTRPHPPDFGSGPPGSLSRVNTHWLPLRFGLGKGAVNAPWTQTVQSDFAARHRSATVPLARDQRQNTNRARDLQQNLGARSTLAPRPYTSQKAVAHAHLAKESAQKARSAGMILGGEGLVAGYCRTYFDLVASSAKACRMLARFSVCPFFSGLMSFSFSKLLSRFRSDFT